MSRVLDDRDDVRSLLGHVDEVTAGSLREFDSVDGAGGTNEVRDVRNGSAGGATKIEHLSSGLHMNVSDTGDDGRGNLGSEGVPDAIFSLGISDLVLLIV